MSKKPFSLGGGAAVATFAGAPSGTCTASQIAVDTTTGSFYDCLSGSWNAVTGGGSAAFSGITSGTNTAAAMVVGNGASLNASGTGTINATTLQTHAASFFQTALGYTPLNPASNLTDVANTATSLSSIGGQTKLGAASTTVSMGGTNGTKALVYVNTTAPLNLSKTYFDGTDWQIAPSAITPNAQVGDYAILGMDNASPDLGKVLTSAKGTAAAWTIAQAGTGAPVKFPSGFFFWVKNVGVGAVTITATTSKFLISDTTGSSTLVILTGQKCLVSSNGTNYVAQCSPATSATGIVTTAQLGSGTADSTTFLRGDNSWAAAGGDTYRISWAPNYGTVADNATTYFYNGAEGFNANAFHGAFTVPVTCTAQTLKLRIGSGAQPAATLTVTIRTLDSAGTDTGQAGTLSLTVTSAAVANTLFTSTGTASLTAGATYALRAVEGTTGGAPASSAIQTAALECVK